MDRLIDTNQFSIDMRKRLIRKRRREFLIAYLGQSLESQDRYSLLNCDGFGRIRRYKNYTLYLPKQFKNASNDVLPFFRGHPPVKELRTQVFQLAGCNWRCWYCFVDFNLLAGDSSRGKYFNAEDLIDLYLSQENRPDILDLSGGQPDLVPEWCLWMMQGLEKKGLAGTIYVWIDDNLSNRYFWRYLSKRERDFVAGFPKSSRMGCFKGFDRESFSYNTGASEVGYDEQFKIFKKFLNSGVEMFAHATFTAPSRINLAEKMRSFVDELQRIHPQLPLRVTPLRIHSFHATLARLNETASDAIGIQNEAMYYWSYELERRFQSDELRLNPSDVQLL